MTAFETLAAANYYDELSQAVNNCTGSFLTVARHDLGMLLLEVENFRKSTAVKRGKAEYPAPFLAAYDAMKDHGARWREGSTPAAAFKQWQARIKAGADAEMILAGTVRYALYCKATGAEVKMAQTFFGPGEHYTPEWALPNRTAPACQPYQTANEKAKEWADRLTGKGPRNVTPDFIDLN